MHLLSKLINSFWNYTNSYRNKKKGPVVWMLHFMCFMPFSLLQFLWKQFIQINIHAFIHFFKVYYFAVMLQATIKSSQIVAPLSSSKGLQKLQLRPNAQHYSSQWGITQYTEGVNTRHCSTAWQQCQAKNSSFPHTQTVKIMNQICSTQSICVLSVFYDTVEMTNREIDYQWKG